MAEGSPLTELAEEMRWRPQGEFERVVVLVVRYASVLMDFSTCCTSDMLDRAFIQCDLILAAKPRKAELLKVYRTSG